MCPLNLHCLIRKKSSVLANAALVYFGHCASLHKSLCEQPNMGKLHYTSLHKSLQRATKHEQTALHKPRYRLMQATKQAHRGLLQPNMSNRPILHVCYLSSFYQVLCHPGDPKQVEPACLCFLVQDVNSYILLLVLLFHVLN